MPLRDHFRPPLDNRSHWEELHGQWPARIVQQLRERLPSGYIAVPHVHPGAQIEIDIAAFQKDVSHSGSQDNGNGGVATAWAPAQPSVDVETELTDFDEYEVRIYDARRDRRLVAAVEIISPANKNRPEHRQVFLAKCTSLLQKGVAVSLIDVVTVRHFNLYLSLLEMLGHRDPSMHTDPPDCYASSIRVVSKSKLQAWSNRLTIGDALPTLPLWLELDLVVPLELESSYEQACRDIWIT